MESLAQVRPPRGGGPEHTILYLSYGDGRHVQETIFSLLSALRRLPPESGACRYVVYTDQPAEFAPLGVTVRTLTKGELEAWLGGGTYIHRRKAMAIKDALHQYGGKVAFVDSDTYFRRSPAQLFERIGPGRSCLHVLESQLGRSGSAQDQAMKEFIQREPLFDTSGRRLSFSDNEPMWNSGVVGVDAADAGLLDEAICLIDQIAPRLWVHHTEQFAIGYALSRIRISGCQDVVFHYWSRYLRDPFHPRLAPLVKPGEGETTLQWAQRAFRGRPQPSPSQWAKMRVKRILRRMGLNTSGILRSA